MCEDTESTNFEELMQTKADELSDDGKILVKVILESEHKALHRPAGQSQLPDQYVTKAIELVEDTETDH
jgi:hypothetical protein